MCDGWTSVSRPRRFSQSSLLLWASDLLGRPGCALCCSHVFVSLYWTASTDKGSLKKTADNSLRWVLLWMYSQDLISAFPHSKHRNTLYCFSPCFITYLHDSHWPHDVISPLFPLLSLPPSYCQSLYRLCPFISTRRRTSVDGGIHFGCQSQQGSGQWAQMCQYLNRPDEWLLSVCLSGLPALSVCLFVAESVRLTLLFWFDCIFKLFVWP